MNKIKIGILGPSEIAYRRFLPALKKSKNFTFVGVAVASMSEWLNGSSIGSPEIEEIILAEREKAEIFKNNYGGKVFGSYKQLIEDKLVDAIYVPLPPLLHYKWGKLVLENKKHLLLEKPFTTLAEQTKELNLLAKNKGLATHENFAFVFHKQLLEINKHIAEIGDIRLVRTCFGFPYRGEKDFRYSKNLGGGALLDCGGYPIKLATHFLGSKSNVSFSQLNRARGHDVDVYGSATLTSECKEFAVQVSFGMDNSYKCELEIWGSEGSLYAPRIFTPTAEMETHISLVKNNTTKTLVVEPDDQFLNSLEHFAKCIYQSEIREKNYETINLQTELMDKVRKEGIKSE